MLVSVASELQSVVVMASLAVLLWAWHLHLTQLRGGALRAWALKMALLSATLVVAVQTGKFIETMGIRYLSTHVGRVLRCGFDPYADLLALLLCPLGGMLALVGGGGGRRVTLALLCGMFMFAVAHIQ
jgi:hypothetical protein